MIVPMRVCKGSFGVCLAMLLLAPAIVLGGANGRLRGNRHIAVEHNEPTANLLLDLADLAVADVDEIGHSTGRLGL